MATGTLLSIDEVTESFTYKTAFLQSILPFDCRVLTAVFFVSVDILSMSSKPSTYVDHRTLGGIFKPQRRLKVICIGAGASGLLLAYKIQRHFDDFELQVFEKNPEVSGTWYENRYPG